MLGFLESYFPWIIIIIAALAVVFVLVLRKLKSKVESELRITDVDSLNEFLEPYGYAYSPQQDIFYTIIDAWQRDMGYTRLYDESAAPASMIIDCEPIYFEYDNKRWMIEFWKGQYGMTSGCEIGVYYTDEPDLATDYFNWTFYDCADDDNMLYMHFALIKNGRFLMRRAEKHWWLTGFKLGEFSQPWELRAYINITLKDTTMRDQFIKGLIAAGYRRDEFIVSKNTVSLKFGKPKTPQPFTRIDEFDEITQAKNKLLCDTFNELTKDYDNTLDKIIALQDIAPDLLENVLLMGKAKSLFTM